MKHAVRTCLLAACGLWAAGAAAQEDASRRAVRADGPAAALEDALAGALRRVLEAENDLHARGLLRAGLSADALEENEEFFAAVLEGLPDRARRALDERTVSFDVLVTMHLHRAGLAAFAEALADDPSLAPADLAPLFDDAFLRDEPLAASEAWRELLGHLAHDERLRARDLAPLVGNAAGRFVVWGALHTPEFWAAHGGAEARAAFLADLLVVALPAPAPRIVALSAFEPPLAVEGVFAGTVAGPLDALRGKVGYTRAHLDVLEAFLLDDLQARARGAPREEGDDGLAAAAAKLRRVAIAELFPDAPELGRDGTVQEALLYWNERLARGGWAAFWDEAKGYLDLLLRGTASHPLDARVRELEALAVEGTLSQGDAAELARLRAQRDGDRRRIADALLGMMAEHGPPDLVRSELLALPQRFAAAAAARTAEPMLRMPWLVVASRDAAGAAGVVRELVVDGAAAGRLPAEAQAGLVMGLQIAAADTVSPAGAEVTDALLAAGISGHPMARATVLVNTAALASAPARVLFEQAFADLETADADAFAVLRGGLLHGLRNRPAADTWVSSLLARSFEQGAAGLWREDRIVESDDLLRFVVNTLSPADYARLAAAGAIPARLRGLRD